MIIVSVRLGVKMRNRKLKNEEHFVRQMLFASLNYLFASRTIREI